MSYIRAKKVDVEEGVISRDGLVSLELPDHDEAGQDLDVDSNLDDELLSAVLSIIEKIDDLDEDEALVVWKVIF